MKFIRGIKNIERDYPKPVITIGIFDGLHIGHREIIEKVVKRAREIGGTSIVLTFEPHPEEILKRETPIKLITILDEKKELMERLGVDVLISIEFTERFARLKAESFIKILVNRLNIEEIFVGSDFLFGCRQKGDIEVLKRLGMECNFKVNVLHQIKKKGLKVSSTEIRRLIHLGKIKEAKEFLGYYPIISGRVEKGDSRGLKLGFPTANLKIEDKKLLPRNGVYAVFVPFNDKIYSGVANIGYRPTFKRKENIHFVEVHILNFSENIYGKTISIHLVKYLRDEKKFKDFLELSVQIRRDIIKARKILKK